MKYKFLLFFLSLVVIITVFSPLSQKTEAAFDAADVLGQMNADGTPNFSENYFSSSYGQDPFVGTGFPGVASMVMDRINHRLFVADYYSRILVYNLDSNNNLADQTPDYVLGGSSLTEAGGGQEEAGPTQDTFYNVYHLNFDPVNNRLFVADSDYYRVLVFDLSSGITNGMNASYVLGQDDFESADQLGSATAANFAYISGMTYDPEDERLFVSDSNYNRISIFDLSGGITNGMDASYVLGQPDFTTSDEYETLTASTTIDAGEMDYWEDGDFLILADSYSGRVLIFDLSGGITNGMDASYVLGQTDFDGTTPGGGLSDSTFIEAPISVATDDSNSLYVGEPNRILVFDLLSLSNGMSADYVWGQQNFTSIANTEPDTIAPTPSEFGSALLEKCAVYEMCVIENNRVLVFNTQALENGQDATKVYGQTDPSGNPNFYKNTEGDAMTDRGFYGNESNSVVDYVGHRLFVPDDFRIVVFNLNENNVLVDKIADNVLGCDSVHHECVATTTVSSFRARNLAYDSERERLFVVDGLGNRILIFDLSSGITNGMNASYVLGQANFTANISPVTSQSQFANTYDSDISFDRVRNRLFVSDDDNGRVLVFDLSSGITNGMNASYVLGQANFTDTVSTLSASTFINPNALELDEGRNFLFVGNASDDGRVLVFDLSSGITNGMDASYVLGQADFTANVDAFTQSILNLADRLAYDSENKLLFVHDALDSSVARLVIFDTETLSNGENAVAVLDETDFTSITGGTSRSVFPYLRGLDYATTTRTLFVRDNVRTLLFNLIDFASGSLTSGTAGTPYSGGFTATSSQGTVTYSLVSGTLPDGLSLNTTTGAITGTPTSATTSAIRVKVTDTISAAQVFYHSQDFTLTIGEAVPVTPSAPPANGPIFVSSGGGSGGSSTAGLPGFTINYVVPNQGQTPSSTSTPSVLPPSPSTPQTPGTSPTVPSSSSSSSSTPFSFPRDLTLENGGQDVKELQILLNTLGYAIATSGPGSPGKETTYFGELTQDALIRFQKAKGIVPAVGYFGPITRGVVGGR